MSIFRRFFASRRSLSSSPPDIANRTRVEIVGEYNYQQALKRIAGPKSSLGASVWTTAALLPEPTNPVDPEAIVCRIEGTTVGYLSRADARAFKRAGAGEGGDSPALISGGRNDPGYEEDYSVGVYLPTAMAIQLESILPINRLDESHSIGCVEVELLGESRYQNILARIAGPKTIDGVSVWCEAL